MRRDEIQAVYSQGVDAVVALVEGLFSIIETQRLDIEILKAQVKELQEDFRLTPPIAASHRLLMVSINRLVRCERKVRKKAAHNLGIVALGWL